MFFEDIVIIYHLWLEYPRIRPVVREFATGTRDGRRHFWRQRLRILMVRQVCSNFRESHAMKTTVICHIFHSQKCPVVKNGSVCRWFTDHRVVHSLFQSVPLEHETRAQYKLNVFVFEYWRKREGLRYSKRHTSRVLRCSTGTLDSCEVWSMFMFEYWRRCKVLRVLWTTHFKCSVVFDWYMRFM